MTRQACRSVLGRFTVQLYTCCHHHSTHAHKGQHPTHVELAARDRGVMTMTHGWLAASAYHVGHEGEVQRPCRRPHALQPVCWHTTRQESGRGSVSGRARAGGRVCGGAPHAPASPVMAATWKMSDAVLTPT